MIDFDDDANFLDSIGGIAYKAFEGAAGLIGHGISILKDVGTESPNGGPSNDPDLIEGVVNFFKGLRP